MLKTRRPMHRVCALLLAVLLLVGTLPLSAMAADDTTIGNGSIFNPGSTKDILINMDDAVFTGMTEEQVVKDLLAALANAKVNTDKVTIRILRQDLDATNVTDWYVYDHYDSTHGKPADFGQPGKYYTAFTETKATGNYTSGGSDYASAGPDYPEIPTSTRKDTLKNVIENYTINGLRLCWALDRHIYSYSTVVPGGLGTYANMVFAGYGTSPLMDFMYYPVAESSIGNIEFDLDTSLVNAHTLASVGFFVNTGLKNDKQVGYLISIPFSGQDATSAIAGLKLYEINSNRTPDDLLNAGSINTTNYTELQSSSNFPPADAKKTHWVISFAGSNLVIKYNTIGDEENVTTINWGIGETGCYGFGPMAQYSSHDCARGTAFLFQNVAMQTKYTNEFLTLRDVYFDTSSNTERYFVNITEDEVAPKNDGGSYDQTYWETVDRLRSDEVFYITTKDNTILDDGGLLPNAGHNGSNGLTISGGSYEDFLAGVASFVYNNNKSRSYDQENLPNSESEGPTAIFSLKGYEGTTQSNIVSEYAQLNSVEVQRIKDEETVYAAALDGSTKGSSDIVKWTYTIYGPDNSVLDTIDYDDTNFPSNKLIPLLELNKTTATGIYKVTLQVKDENGKTSTTVTREFEVVKDIQFPTVTFGPDTLTKNDNGEYEQHPQTFDLTDIGWGIDDYSVKYVEHGTNSELSGITQPGGGSPMPPVNVVETIDAPGGLPIKYDIIVRATDWAGNALNKTVTVNTIKKAAEDAIKDLDDLMTTVGTIDDVNELADVLEAIKKAEDLIAIYDEDYGKTDGDGLSNITDKAAADAAVDAFYNTPDGAVIRLENALDALEDYQTNTSVRDSDQRNELKDLLTEVRDAAKIIDSNATTDDAVSAVIADKVPGKDDMFNNATDAAQAYDDAQTYLNDAGTQGNNGYDDLADYATKPLPGNPSDLNNLIGDLQEALDDLADLKANNPGAYEWLKPTEDALNDVLDRANSLTQTQNDTGSRTVKGTVEKDDDEAGTTTSPVEDALVTITGVTTDYYAETTTDPNGKFTFNNLPDGIYSVSVVVPGADGHGAVRNPETDKAETTMTVVIPNEGGDLEFRFPHGKKNATLTIIGNTKPVSVDGLNDEAQFAPQTNPQAGFTASELSYIGAGQTGRLLLELTAEDVTSQTSKFATQFAAIKQVAGRQTVAYYVDLNMYKHVWQTENSAVETNQLYSIPEIVKVTIPIPENLRSQNILSLLRYHDGQAERLPLVEQPDGTEECVYLSPDHSYFDAYVHKFSVYAIAYGKTTSGGGNYGNPNSVPNTPAPTTTPEPTLPPVLVNTVKDTGDLTVPDGKQFVGWSTTENGPVEFLPGETLTSDAELTLYPVYISKNLPALNRADHFAYIVGVPGGTIQAENNITRQEVATILFRLLTDESRAKYATAENPFADVAEDLWSRNAITTMANAGIVKGTGSGLFDPQRQITRAEFVTMISRFDDRAITGADTFSDVAGHWAEEAILKASAYGFVKGNGQGEFRPDDAITRAEAMAIINRLLARRVDAAGIHEEAIRWPDVPSTAWYYCDVMEATNSHDYERELDSVEDWTAITAPRDWTQLEH